MGVDGYNDGGAVMRIGMLRGGVMAGGVGGEDGRSGGDGDGAVMEMMVGDGEVLARGEGSDGLWLWRRSRWWWKRVGGGDGDAVVESVGGGAAKVRLGCGGVGDLMGVVVLTGVAALAMEMKGAAVDSCGWRRCGWSGGGSVVMEDGGAVQWWRERETRSAAVGSNGR
ncbi:hypothetical protein F0562_012121 [Nyssa sinensis]|uniref:Uncharacterized protein n=1 Tax=Nyssa sinensis TaxID=561372 RepID=A0A5J4ZUC2_9ASTE|nr:hypothetical protein F0562_012121 [Nyssa sinensis]